MRNVRISLDEDVAGYQQPPEPDQRTSEANAIEHLEKNAQRIRAS
jgi:hypothetical protein